ncbi:MAG: TonB-dependent receptor, partial [Pacificimonas sp.]
AVRFKTLLACCILPLASSALAQGDIVVTGTALTQPDGADAYAVQTLPRDALTDMPSGQLENALYAIPGFQLFRRSDARSANPTSQGATLRGVGGNASSRALVLLDGVPVADPFAGWIPWAALPPESLSLIRATTGGGAGAFGAGALSGTLELVSAGPAERGSSLRARYGSRDSIDLGAALVANVGSGFVTVDAAYAEGDGFFTTAPADRGAVDTASPYDQQSLTARAVFPVGDTTELQLRAAAFHDDRQRGQRLVTSGNEGADASLRLVSRGDLPWEALGYVQARKYQATFARTAGDRSTEQPALDQYNVPGTGVGAKLELRPSIGAHDLRIGTDWRHAKGETRERFDFDGTALTALRRAGGRSDTVGVFAETDWQVSDTLTLTGGARLDRWWLTDGRFRERGAGRDFADRSGWEPTARIGAAYDVTPAIKLRGAGYLGWRLPTLNELYRPFRVGPDAVAANPALEPERSRGVEIGFDYQPLSTARFSLTAFTMRAENIISNITLAEGPGVFPGTGFVFGSFRQRLNLDAVDARGLETSVRLDFGAFSLSGSYALTDSEQRGSGLTAAQDGFRPPQIPRHR